MTATIPDTINARDTGQGSRFTPHPDGQYAAVCADIIYLGERLETFAGKQPKVMDKCALVFVTGEENAETGQLHEIAAEFTVSMNERASLRAFLEAWRGKSYTDEQAKAGVPLHKLARMTALIAVEHKVSKNGRTYAKVKSIQPLPKQMANMIDVSALMERYERAPFWTERKDAYQAEVRAFRSQQARQMPSDDFAPLDESDAAVVDESDLPF